MNRSILLIHPSIYAVLLSFSLLQGCGSQSDPSDNATLITEDTLTTPKISQPEDTSVKAQIDYSTPRFLSNDFYLVPVRWGYSSEGDYRKLSNLKSSSYRGSADFLVNTVIRDLRQDQSHTVFNFSVLLDDYRVFSKANGEQVIAYRGVYKDSDEDGSLSNQDRHDFFLYDLASDSLHVIDQVGMDLTGYGLTADSNYIQLSYTILSEKSEVGSKQYFYNLSNHTLMVGVTSDDERLIKSLID